MMDWIEKHKNAVLAALCLLLLVFAGLAASNGYRRLPPFHKKTITIGVFSDSYWEV